MHNRALTVLSVLVVIAPSAKSQQLPRLPGETSNARKGTSSHHWEASEPTEFYSSQLNWALGNAPDYRWEGVMIGAVTVGIGGALLANGFCDYGGTHDENCFGRTVVGGAIGATVGAVVGGLIGGLIPKKRAEP